jgi:hypothetical protein
MAVQQDRKLGWRFWLKWVVANLLGITLSLAIPLLLVELNSTIASIQYGSSILGCSALWVSFGVPAGVGFSQQLILRPQAVWTKRWIWFTISGWIMGFFAAAFLTSLVSVLDLAQLEVIGVSVFGLTTGTAQMTLLRQHVNKSGWWIVANVMSFAIGSVLFWRMSMAANRMFVPVMTGAPNPFERLLIDGLLIGIVVSAFVFSVITGLTMLWLLNHPKPSVQVATSSTQVN